MQMQMQCGEWRQAIVLKDSVGIKGGGSMGHLPPSPVEGSAPYFPPVRRKNCQNQPILANFLIFAPSMPPAKKFVVPPLLKKHCSLPA